MRWLEDLAVGEVIELGAHRFSAEEIIAFARDFDPQPFHLSHEAGRASLFKGLAASGWHTTAVWQRLMRTYEAAARLDAGIVEAPPARALPVEDLRWLKPTLADDEIQFRVTLEAISPHSDSAGWGTVTYRAEGTNQHGDLVFRLTGRSLVPKRATG
jgi:acyl dehydratase